jgi:hypothetical protein
MRKLVWLVSLAAATTFLIPGSAAAKGSKLRFEEEQYAPGDHAVANALVETWPGSGQPEDAPYTVYLIRGGPLWFGHLPPDAMPVGELRIGDQVPDETEVGDTYRVSVALNVPRVSDGRYSVWVCAPGEGGNGCLIGFGDLVYGRLIVSRGTEPDVMRELDPQVATAAPQGVAGAAPSPGGSIRWAGFALAGVAFAALMVLLVRRRRGRTSG